ncbi:MAG TPA: hypothetical protein ENI71_01215 [Chromatiales bacterium]|nr:hypothetical protein [Chromatiales bacterium]
MEFVWNYALRAVLLVTACGLLAPATASAEPSVTAGGGLWNQDPSGTVQHQGDTLALDLGSGVKYLDGSVQIRSEGRSTSTRTTEVPMLYLHTGIPLPIHGVSLVADAGFVTYAGNRLLDYTIKGTYETRPGLGAEVGWRDQQLRLKNFQNANVDVTWRGPYAGLFYRF